MILIAVLLFVIAFAELRKHEYDCAPLLASVLICVVACIFEALP
jgi:hypothetical protein